MSQKDKILDIMIWGGMLLIVAGICIPFFTGPHETVYKYIFSAGSALNLIGRLFTTYHGDNIRVKRLFRIEVWASLFFCVAAFFMFYDQDPRNWIVFVLAGGALLAYTSIMIPRAQRKNK